MNRDEVVTGRTLACEAQDTAPRRSGRPPLTDRAALLGAARTLGFAGLTVG